MSIPKLTERETWLVNEVAERVNALVEAHNAAVNGVEVVPTMGMAGYVDVRMSVEAWETVRGGATHVQRD